MKIDKWIVIAVTLLISYTIIETIYEEHQAKVSSILSTSFDGEIIEKGFDSTSLFFVLRDDKDTFRIKLPSIKQATNFHQQSKIGDYIIKKKRKMILTSGMKEISFLYPNEEIHYLDSVKFYVR
jgi:hypothetical protein